MNLSPRITPKKGAINSSKKLRITKKSKQKKRIKINFEKFYNYLFSVVALILSAYGICIAVVTLDRTVAQFEKEDKARSNDSIYQFKKNYSDSIQTSERFKQLETLLYRYDSLAKNHLETSQDLYEITKTFHEYQNLNDRALMIIDAADIQFTGYQNEVTKFKPSIGIGIKNNGRRPAYDLKSRLSTFLLGDSTEENINYAGYGERELYPGEQLTIEFTPEFYPFYMDKFVIRVELSYMDVELNKSFSLQQFYKIRYTNKFSTLISVTPYELKIIREKLQKFKY